MDIKKIISKHITLNITVCVALMILVSLGLTAASLLLQTNGTGDIIACIKRSGGMMFLLNFLPVVLMMLCVFFLSGSFSFATGLVSIVILAASMINRLKITLRHDPFLPWDVMLGGEALSISKAFGTKAVVQGVVSFFGVMFFFVLFVFFIRNKKMRVITRICGVAAMLAASYLCNERLLKNYEINQSLYIIGNRYNQVDVYDSKGFIYSFIYSFNTSRIEKPENYSTAEIAERIKNFKSREDGELSGRPQPNIIMILGEGFTELPMSPALNYDGFTDPMANYKKLKEESISGYMIVPNCGGGTADTEFDIMTGINTRHFRGAPYANVLITKEFPSFATVLDKAGYDSVAIHPGHAWFYNRVNVYRFFGFDEFIDLKQFDEKDNKGMYMSETATFDRIISEHERHKAQQGDKPFFDFCITIQNHGPYEDKYLAEQNFNSDFPFDEHDISAISNYNEGVADTDRELKRLVDYFRDSEEPTVIILWGDHLPLLSHTAYDALMGRPEDTESFEGKTRLYKTPFIIWENDAAKKIIPNQWDYENNDIISSNYLGVAILDYLGHSGVDPYFDFINELKKTYPIVFERQFFTRDRVLHDNMEERNPDIELLRRWEYYRVFDER